MARQMQQPAAAPTRPVRGRDAKQERSAKTCRLLSQATVAVIAERGIAGVTHRLVAERAGVSLAATTYYYATKFDLLAEASNAILRGYVEAFARAAERYRGSPRTPGAFGGFVARLVRNAAGRHRDGTIAWAEIMLDAVRHGESLVLSREWNHAIDQLWRDIADATGVDDPAAVARSGIDTTIGLLLMTVALDLSEPQVDAVLVDGADPLEAWRVDRTSVVETAQHPCGRKATETRQRILDAAIEIMISDGPTAMTYRSIARRAGLTAAAPSYHFRTMDDLLRAAQVSLFEDSKARYRAAVAGIDYRNLDIESLADVTAVVFQREATEGGRRNLATYAIWLEAARRPELRPLVWSAIVDQYGAWRRLLAQLNPQTRPIDGLIVQAIFVGKLVRILSTGSQTEDLARVRREFASDIGALACRGILAMIKNMYICSKILTGRLGADLREEQGYRRSDQRDDAADRRSRARRGHPQLDRLRAGRRLQDQRPQAKQ